METSTFERYKAERYDKELLWYDTKAAVNKPKMATATITSSKDCPFSWNILIFLAHSQAINSDGSDSLHGMGNGNSPNIIGDAYASRKNNFIIS